MTPLSPIRTTFETMRAGNAERRIRFGLGERRAALDRLASVMRANEKAIVEAVRSDLGRPEAETILIDYLTVLQDIRHARRRLHAWMRPRRVAPTFATFGASGKVIPQPRGTCLIISPWNLPFCLALSPLVSCLAAGNAAILKPSEVTPASSALIARMIAAAFPPDLVSVIEGGKEVAEELLALPFDHIFFTGSPAVGKIVMAAAARNLTSVTLELGGKSPVIVGEGADIERAADWIVFGKFLNAGQVCIAPDHLFVHVSIKDRFLSALRARIAKAYGTAAASENLCQIVSDQHASRLSALIADALEKGADPVHDNGGEGRTRGPLLLQGITPEMLLDQEEIFGPILPILPFDDLSPVIDRINARDKPLALYIFDRDQARIDRIISQTTSGGVGINLTVVHYTQANLPFGGVNTSGIGAAHGEWGFRAFSHERAILQNRFLALPLLFPPYDRHKMRLIGLIKRVLG
ncbi:aldehyde dehydrogenase family protein [Tabrizicola sp. YIM 78059]|uniref:aldehyde dehydrogenase family protein n=1 Tax=Tabrizicola sp. YIM 78059 TaxID=2529861 RepID=UPI0010AA0C85|nr:aldehyde dehydrogenase family protein [Tabrizicola sp. YIM 78059]